MVTKHRAPIPQSARALAQAWLESNFTKGRFSLVEYHERSHQLHEAIRLGIDSAATKTDGVLSTVKSFHDESLLTGRWYFASVDCDHFASEEWERTFACSYRNTQIVLSALFRLPAYRERLFGPISAMPSIWKLQTLLESAWQSGFDPVGRSQIADVLSFMHTQAQATSNSTLDSSRIGLWDSTVWLGATDVAALLGYVGVKCCIVDCPASHQTNRYHKNLSKHLLDYFKLASITSRSSSASTIQTLPVYLQYEGHSLVVIGVEADGSDQPTALMLLDPNTPAASMRSLKQMLINERTRQNRPASILSGGSSSPTWSQVIGAMRVDVTKLKSRSYQLIQVDGLLETEQDIHDAMIPENIRITL